MTIFKIVIQLLFRGRGKWKDHKPRQPTLDLTRIFPKKTDDAERGDSSLQLREAVIPRINVWNSSK